MKKIIEPRHLEYLKNLLNEYRNATGAKKISIDDLLNDRIASEFYNWLEERSYNTEDYKMMVNSTCDALNRLPGGGYYDSHIYESFSACEFGKGTADSIVYDTNASVVSMVADAFPKKYRRNRVIGDLNISYGRPKFVDLDGNAIRPEGVKIYMTHNPYSFASVNGLEDIHNSGRARVLFGVYGSVFDKDKNKKLSEFRRISDRFSRDPSGRYYAHIFQDIAHGNRTYFAFLISKDTNGLLKDKYDSVSHKRDEDERLIRYVRERKRGK